MFHGGQAEGRPTFCSVPFDAVCARTTLWANFMQQILIGVGAPSHMRNILDLIAVMSSQLSLWYELCILRKTTIVSRVPVQPGSSLDQYFIPRWLKEGTGVPGKSTGVKHRGR